VLEKLVHCLVAAINDRRGLETLEYAVFGVAFVGLIVGGVALLGADMSAAYTGIGTYIQNQVGQM